MDTIEHGYGLDDETIDLMVRRGVFWCPTIYVGVYVAQGRAAAGAPIWITMVDVEKQAFAKALRKGVKIAYGTDAGGYAWTEPQARELTYMVRYGMTPLQAIESATRVGAELLAARPTSARWSRAASRRDRRGRRSAPGHRGAGEGPLRDEGRADREVGQAGVLSTDALAAPRRSGAARARKAHRSHPCRRAPRRHDRVN